MTPKHVVPSSSDRGFPGIGLGFFMRRRAESPGRIAALALISAVLALAGAALLWLI